jgi:hypothetical protein
MNSRDRRPFWDGPIEERIARLELRLAAAPAPDQDEDALQLALQLLEQLRAEGYRPQLAG